MTIDYTAHLRADGERMTLAVGRDLDAHVPTCPAWNVAKLTIHTGQHHRWVADAVRKRGEMPEDPPKPGLRGDELVEWFREGWRDLADLLDTVGEDDPAWSWSGDNRAGFWKRRTALETLVHRWDAENAVGSAGALDPELAADGIDEALFVMTGEGGAYDGVAFRMVVTTSDAGGPWTLELVDGRLPRASRELATGDDVVTVSGTAGDVLLFLWGRHGAEAVALDGSEEAKAALLRWTDE
ncbi:MAG TPA: maleylpyruvate isomerase family mycothiol-dependent enzyme [Actinomycetota bacterium]|nr:maleylpyruvate isomerase family mycothiol-dependent enzyme [Actinomycetota bacterium]